MLFSSRRKAIVDTLVQAPVSIQAGRSPWVDARIRFMRNKAALASLATLLLIVLVCAAGPALLPYDFDSADWDAMKLPPCWAFGAGCPSWRCPAIWWGRP